MLPGPADGAAPASAAARGRAALAMEALQGDLEDLGLTKSEARVMVALLRTGSANSLQLARACKVSRTNVYRTMDGLARRRLVQRLPGDGPARWASPGREQLIDRLHDDQEDRLRAVHTERKERLAALHAEHERKLRELSSAHEERLRDLDGRVSKTRELLAEVVKDHGPSALLQVHLIPSARQLKQSYEQLLAGVRTELLVFVRPPYSWSAGSVNPFIVDALSRGVEARVLYEATELDDPDAEGFRREIATYHEAGVHARVVQHLPIKLAVFDRKVALVALMDSADTPYPTFLLVEHEGFASFLGEAFDNRWDAAEPYRAVPVGGRTDARGKGRPAPSPAGTGPAGRSAKASAAPAARR